MMEQNGFFVDVDRMSTNKPFLDWTSVESQLFEKQGHVQRLVEAYQRCCCSRSQDENIQSSYRELVFITGPSGVGKTGLALTLEKAINRDGGWFCRGKFDQPTTSSTTTNASTTADGNINSQQHGGPFVEAVAQLAHQATTQRGKSFLESLQSELTRLLDSSEIQAMEESIPCLKKITSRHPATGGGAHVEERWCGLKGPEAEKRYTHIFAKFIQALCSAEHPLVLLIDDLQWADPTSLELLKELTITNQRSAGLLLVCTARHHHEESEDAHFAKTLLGIKEAGVAIVEIQLSNMDEPTINNLLSDMLQSSVEETKLLSKILSDHTNGNLFFFVQLLNVLHGDGLVRFDAESEKWTWDEEAIVQAYTNHETVLDFLVKRVLHLTELEQRVLKTASCLGGAIYECLLAEVVFPTASVRPALQTVEELGLITFDFELGSGHFLHDRIQEATYSLIPESSRTRMHLDIGRRLWIWLHPSDLDIHLFTVVNQIIRGLHLLDDQVENNELAALMLRAGRKAALLSSFSMAATYFDIGINLLGRKRWKNHYTVCLALFTAAAEVEYYNGNLVRVDCLLSVIFKHAKTLDDKMCARFTQIYSLGSRDDMKQALNVGLDVLKSLGVTFPKVQWKIMGDLALERCRRRLNRMSDDDIMNLKTMDDKKLLVTMRLLNTIFVIALPVAEELFPFVVVQMIELTLQHGISSMSCVGFALFGFCLGRRGYLEDGYRFGDLGLRISERFQAQEWQARVTLVVAGNVYTVRQPIQEMHLFLLPAHRAGLVVGDIHCSLVCASFQCRAWFFTSEFFGKVVSQLEEYRKLCCQYSQQSVGLMLTHQLQVCYNFMGRSIDPLVLTGEAMNEADTMSFLQGKHPVALYWLLMMKHFLAVYFNESQEAQRIASLLKKMKSGPVPPYFLYTHLFLHGLSVTILSQTDVRQKRRARRILEKLKSDKRIIFRNSENKICLLEAESAVSRGDRDTALLKYAQSIAAAQREGFRHEEALACEKAGITLLGWGDQAKAHEYFSSARLLYSQWGAQAKVDQVNKFLQALTGYTTN